MTNSKNNKMTLIGKRVLISWAIIAVIFLIIGFSIGTIVSNDKNIPEQLKSSTQSEVMIFGKLDGRMFNGEFPINWENDNTSFIPLNVPMSENLQEFTFYLSSAYDIDFTFTMALIKKESDFQPNIISNTNDYGLMQINEINHLYLKEQLELTNFLEPHDNI